MKHTLIPCAALAVALALSMSAPAVAADPVKIADLRAFDLQLDAADYSKAGSGTLAPFEIRTPDAAFIKVHFDHFSLPDGLVLEVSNPDGSEVYRYSKQHRDALTVAKELGQNGDTSFSAMSISGPVAVIRLTGVALEPWGKQHGVTVTRYLEGFPEAMLPELQQQGLLDKAIGPTSICGTDNKQAVACYAASEPAAVDRSRPVARLVMGGGGLCTAWRVGSGNHLFTNNHCVASTADVGGSEVWFNYQKSTCGGSDAAVTKVPGDTLLRTDTTLDYSLFTVKNFANVASFGYLGLDVRRPAQNELIYISGHPGGRQKELSIVSDQDGGGHCRINAPVTNGSGTNTDSGYTCDTEGGSSGSPVIARSTNKAIALHHLGGCNNTGARFELIWPQVSTYFGGTVPVGDGGGGGNVAPVANYTFGTSGLTATFTDASSDSDGSIASRSWNFGDGTTSTATSPSKTYAASGTYNVALTVTDNGGLSNTTTKAVTVSSGGGGGTVLTNGVAVTGLAATTGNSLNYTMVVPAGATGLKFVTSGGTGDMDMYVKFGSAPTDTVYDCRPYATGNAETCNIATAQAGTYHVRLKAYSSFTGVSVTGSFNTGVPGVQTYTNGTDFNITDNATVDSPVTVSGRTGNAPANASISVSIIHTYQGDLKVDLVAPDGTLYNIHNRTGGSVDNVSGTFVRNLSSEALNGVWKLRVNDNAGGDVGRIDTWSITF
jgi:PKD repeat protein